MFGFLKGRLNADYGILSNRNFLFSALTRGCIFSAKLVRTTVMGWFIYAATGNPVHLGSLALVEAVPDILAVLFSGYIADKYGRKVPTAIVTVAEFVLTLWLCYLVSQPFDNSSLTMIYICAFCFGIFRGLFERGILNSLIALVVKREHTHKATVWDGIFLQSFSIAAPIVAGLVYDVKGPVWALSIVLVEMAIAFGLISFVKDVIIPNGNKTETPWQNMTAGLRFIFSSDVLRSTVLLDFVAVVFSGVTGLLPVFAKDILHTGPDGLGVLRSSISIGSLAAGLFLAHYHLRGRVGRQFVAGMTLFSLSLLVFAYSESFYLSLAMLFLSGGFDWYSTMIRGTIARLMTPDRLQGRVAAARTFFANSANEISSFESGILAGWLGTVPSIVAGSVVTLAAIAVTLWKSKEIPVITMEDLIARKD